MPTIIDERVVDYVSARRKFPFGKLGWFPAILVPTSAMERRRMPRRRGLSSGEVRTGEFSLSADFCTFVAVLILIIIINYC